MATATEARGTAPTQQSETPTNDVRRGSLISLAQRLEQLRQTAHDVVAPTTAIRMREDAAELSIPAGEYGARNESYPLTHHAHIQLAEKCGIPFRYYDAMLKHDGFGTLLAQNVNAWLGEQADRRLIRVADGRVRAILSDRYRVLDNYDLAMLVAEKAMAHHAQVLACDLTETRMYVKITVPEYREAVKAGDDIVPGLIVSNSEVGAGAFRVEPFLYRLVCKNGMIGESSLYKIHVGERLELGELIYSDQTRKLADQTLWAQVSDVIDSTFRPEVLRAQVQALRESQSRPIAKPQEVVDVAAKNLALSEEKRLSLLRYFAQEGDTVFGIVNGITRLAQDFEDAEDQVRLERFAGEVLAAPKILAVA